MSSLRTDTILWPDFVVDLSELQYNQILDIQRVGPQIRPQEPAAATGVLDVKSHLTRHGFGLKIQKKSIQL